MDAAEHHHRQMGHEIHTYACGDVVSSRFGWEWVEGCSWAQCSCGEIVSRAYPFAYERPVPKVGA